MLVGLQYHARGHAVTLNISHLMLIFSWTAEPQVWYYFISLTWMGYVLLQDFNPSWMSPVCRFDPAAVHLPRLRLLTPSAAAAVTVTQRAAALSVHPAQSHGSGVIANAPIAGSVVERPGTTRTTPKQRSVKEVEGKKKEVKIALLKLVWFMIWSFCVCLYFGHKVKINNSKKTSDTLIW